MKTLSLTRGETEIMNILWLLEKAFVKDILALMPDPKPAYNTVSTFIRILEKKKLIDHITYGNTYQYFPLISKEAFRRYETHHLMDKYFNNSVTNLISFLLNENDLIREDIQEIIDFIEKNRTQK